MLCAAPSEFLPGTLVCQRSRPAPTSLSLTGPGQFFKKSLIRRGLRRAGRAGGEGAAQGSLWNERPALKGSEWPLITPWCSGAVLFSRKDLCSWSQWGTFLLINRGHPTYSETTFQQAHQPQWPRSPGGNVLRGGSRCTLGSQVSSIDTPGPA